MTQNNYVKFVKRRILVGIRDIQTVSNDYKKGSVVKVVESSPDDQLIIGHVRNLIISNSFNMKNTLGNVIAKFIESMPNDNNERNIRNCNKNALNAVSASWNSCKDYTVLSTFETYIKAESMQNETYTAVDGRMKERKNRSGKFCRKKSCGM